MASGALMRSDWEELSGGALTITYNVPAIAGNFSHVFAGVQFADDDAGTTAGVPTAGTATWTIKTDVLPDSFQAIATNNNGTGGVIDYSVSDIQADWQGPTKVIRVVLSGITGTNVDYARLSWMTFRD